MRFCTVCGAALRSDAAFCSQCGTPVPPEAAPLPLYQQPLRSDVVNKRQTVGASGLQAKPSRIVGIIGFAFLTILVVSIFLLTQVSLVGLLSAFAVMLCLFSVQQIVAKKGILTTVLLMLASVVLSFVLLVIFMPSTIRTTAVASGDLHTTVAPSEKETVVKYGAVKIRIPGGTVTQAENLSVTQPAELSGALADFAPVCPALDVDLGDLKSFEKPLQIEIPYDKSKIGDGTPAEAFVAVFYNETSGSWEDVPYQVDEKAQVVQLTMYHLTTVQCYYSMWEGQFVYDNGTVSVMYHTGGNFGPKYATYEKTVGRTTGDKYKPQFVVDVADNTAKILKAYADAGLTVPAHPKVYITANTNEYRTMSGVIMLGADAAENKDPEKELLVNLAHELFHSAQGLTIGLVDYSAAYYKNAAFWIDASADYMANTGVWALLKAPAVDKYDPYGIDFFQTSLFTCDGGHEYEAASFIKFAQGLQKAKPYDLVTLAESYGSFSTSFAKVYGAAPPNNDLLAYYRAYLEYSLFDSASNFRLKTNTALEKEIGNTTGFEFKLDEQKNGLASSPPIEGKEALTFSGAYSAGFYRFTTNCDTILTVTPTADVALYVIDRTQGDRGYTRRATATAGGQKEIGFGKNEYVLMTAVSAAGGSTGFSFKALPKIIDITGKWNLTSLVYTDAEGSPEFWGALQSEFGYDKSSYLAEANANAKTMATAIYLMIGSAGENKYTLKLYNPDGEAILMDDVQVTGITLTAKGQSNGLWANIKATLKDGQLTGVIRAQMMVGSGDKTYTGTDVITLTAKQEVVTLQ